MMRGVSPFGWAQTSRAASTTAGDEDDRARGEQDHRDGDRARNPRGSR